MSVHVGPSSLALELLLQLNELINLPRKSLLCTPRHRVLLLDLRRLRRGSKHCDVGRCSDDVARPVLQELHEPDDLLSLNARKLPPAEMLAHGAVDMVLRGCT